MMDERIMVHAMTLFIPYSRQLRRISISSRPLLPVLSVLNALKPLPRLELLHLSNSDTYRDGFSLTANDPGELLFDPFFRCLDLSETDHCQKLTIKSWRVLGEIVAPSHAGSIDIEDCCDRWTEVPWDSFVKFFSNASGLEDLRLDPIYLRDMPRLEAIPVTHSYQSP